jgi:hypothetical protein
VELEQWKQGPELWNRVLVPRIREDQDPEESAATESLPHRPDAFFSLFSPGRPTEKQRSHFLYEADRGTENTTRFKDKAPGPLPLHRQTAPGNPQIPLYLKQPEVVFNRIWANPVVDKFFNLAD